MGEIDEPLAYTPPKVVGVRWKDGILYITLDRAVTSEWVDALINMGSFTSAMGAAPRNFSFDGNVASVAVEAQAAQSAIDYFKQWLPTATNTLKYRLENAARRKEQQRREQLLLERRTLELHAQVNSTLRI